MCQTASPKVSFVVTPCINRPSSVTCASTSVAASFTGPGPSKMTTASSGGFWPSVALVRGFFGSRVHSEPSS